MDTYSAHSPTSRNLVPSVLPLSPWTLHFLETDREAAYIHSLSPSAAACVLPVRTGRTPFFTAYIASWVLMVVAIAGAYGLGNLPEDLCTLQLSVLGALALGSIIFWMLSKVISAGTLEFIFYPLLFLWAVLCYSFADERFSERIAAGGYTGSMSTCVLPAAVLFLLLPGAMDNRFLCSALSGLSSILIISGFQVAGVRVNSGLVDSMLYFIIVAVTCWRTYVAERQQRLEFYFEVTQPSPNKEELETWGLVDETSTEADALMKKLREVHSAIAGAAAVGSSQVRERLKSAMAQLLDVGKDLATRSRAADQPMGIMCKTVDSEYRLYLEEKFLPVQVSTPHSSRARAQPMMYGSQELTPMLNQLEKNWNFDMFFLAQISGLRPLEVTGGFSVKRYGLETELQFNEARLLRFLQELESKYKPNPYHNSTHAADVLNSLLFLYKQSDIFKEITDFELFGSIIAALGHDVGHPAFSNRYLISTQSSFALICNCYADNDVSVLEMMHAALTYELLNQEQVLAHLSREQWMTIRRIVTEMILATDMMRHFEFLEGFRKRFSGKALPSSDFEDKLALYKMCIKCADIAHAAKSVELHEKWTLKVVEEFFHQGDLEREQGLPISMFCDRLASDLPKNQSGFILNVVRPLYIAANSILRSTVIDECVIAQMDVNLEFWKRRGQRRKRASIAPGPAITHLEVDEEQKEGAGSLMRAVTRLGAGENM